MIRIKFAISLVVVLISSSAFAKGNAKKGKALYDTVCFACHQTDGAGKPGMGPKLNTPDLLFLANDAFFKKTILDGRPGTSMMGYKVMPNVKAGIDDLIAYFRSWESRYKHTSKRIKVDWKKTIKGDKRAGRKSFRTYCSSCHGPNGGGYADGGSGLAIGLSGFLDAASDDFIMKTIQQGRTGTAMKPFGHGRGLANISEKEIKNIVSYLRSLN